jgi:phosphoribosylglycinamide formyltransferase-1
MKFDCPGLGILVSGRGSNMQAIMNAIARGDLPAKVVAVVSDKADAVALEIAAKNNIPNYSLAQETISTRDQKIQEIFKRHKVDVVVLAGYNKLIRKPLLRTYSDLIINIHPAPLPRFGGKGMHQLPVHEAVLKAGVKFSGPTVHLVNEQYDKGQILAHVKVPVKLGDTPEALAARVLPYEHDLYWRVIKNRFCK